MSGGGYTDDELAGLSAEERAALVDGADDEQATLRAVLEDGGDSGDGDGDGGGDGGDGDGGDGGAAAGADKAGGKAGGEAGGAAAAAGDGGDGGGEDDQPTRFVPSYTAEAPENYEARVQEIADSLKEARKSWRDGQLTDEALAEREAELHDQRAELERQKVKAEMAAEANEQRAAQEWQFEVKMFMRHVRRTDGLDYQAKGNEHLWAELDNQVKVLGNDPKNADKSGEWFLEAAHERVKRIHGLAAKPAGAKPEGGDDKGGDGDDKGKGGRKSEHSERRPDKALPKTLGGVPAAAPVETGGDGEFAHLDGLDGLELEVALAKLSPEQQDRYARA